MIKILITGKNSYVGTSLESWLEKFDDNYSIESISLRDDSWKSKDFSDYDVVIHVAGIAHIKETSENADIYYRVNRDLAYEVAQKAKCGNVKQFIFFSSMSVYGINTGIINKDSLPKPNSNYGKSKLEAEKLILPMADENFKIAIIRPPMIYGKHCKGNYVRLSRIATQTLVFPYIENKRSMIYIDNLCEFIRKIIENNSDGLYFPQNLEYVCTSDLVKEISERHEKKLFLTKIFNPVFKLCNLNIFKKVFGDLLYEKSMSSHLNFEYTLVNFKDSVKATEE
ncbi:NAD-dependent epimerase [Sporosarcina sp. P16b]|uniref:NAD-dependent epimerase/dehydratase family protein n=1 Tax=Sporosarcina sp. P16b TaxID=2048261 RepID=UPI000C16A3E2|nr:NAD-dependent epimerase/dehydratase family protein [Sporosarcina sp. P16b]PIC69183.1 NAD-dependent epimerase [Sporosarcina sp. P16b]